MWPLILLLNMIFLIHRHYFYKTLFNQMPQSCAISTLRKMNILFFSVRKNAKITFCNTVNAASLEKLLLLYLLTRGPRTQEYKNLYPGGHEIYNFGTPFLGHHYNVLCLIYAWEQRR